MIGVTLIRVSHVDVVLLAVHLARGLLGVLCVDQHTRRRRHSCLTVKLESLPCYDQ